MTKMKLSSLAPWLLVALFGLAGAGCATDDEFGYGEGALEAEDDPGVVEEELGVDEPDLDGEDEPGLD